jgi:large subunit ribosomal protein L1
LEKKDFEKAIDEAFKNSKPRKFDEAVELILTLKNIALKNKEQRLDFTVNLPHPYKKQIKSIIFLKDKNLASQLKGVVNKILFEEDVKKISKKEGKKLANEFDLFLAEGPVMLTVGKHLGQILSPRNKMPVVAPPNVDAIKVLLKTSLAKQKISNKKNKSSVAVQIKIGQKSLSVEELAKNMNFVYDAVVEKLPAGKHNIKHVFIKTTMGSPIKVGENK